MRTAPSAKGKIFRMRFSKARVEAGHELQPSFWVTPALSKTHSSTLNRNKTSFVETKHPRATTTDKSSARVHSNRKAPAATSSVTVNPNTSVAVSKDSPALVFNE